MTVPAAIWGVEHICAQRQRQALSVAVPNSWGLKSKVTSASEDLLVEASVAFPSSRDFSAVLDEESLGGTGDVDAAGVAGACSCLSTPTSCASGGCCSGLTMDSGFLLSAGACEV